jgi:hypothetical protein
MRITGEWRVGLDGVPRPMAPADLRDRDGRTREVWFLVDTGADRTVLDFDTYLNLGLDSLPAAGFELEGVGGNTGSVVVRLPLQFLRDDGVFARFNADVLAFTEPTALGMNFLGRDILNYFAVVADYEGRTVCLVRGNHRCVIQEA